MVDDDLKAAVVFNELFTKRVPKNRDTASAKNGSGNWHIANLSFKLSERSTLILVRVQYFL